MILYIPIWFYSNKDFAHFMYTFLNFTFQSGSILINAPADARPLWFFFTFQSGSILIDGMCLITPDIRSPLHSNLVLF